MKKHSIILLVLFAIAACTTPTIVQYERTGTVESIRQSNQHRCKYKLTVWCETEGRYYYIYIDSLYQPGSKFIIRNK